MVSVFSADDIPGLEKAAGMDSTCGLLTGEAADNAAADELNWAIQNAALAAEGARTHLPPAALETGCREIAKAGRSFLKSLGFPSDPDAYTRDPDASPRDRVTEMFGQSAIAHALYRSAPRDIEPLPIPDLPDGAEPPTSDSTRDTPETLRAIKGPPTPAAILPTAIAKATLPREIYEHLIQPHVNQWIHVTDDGPRKIEAAAEVECLLGMAPGAVALTVALAENLKLVKDTIRPNKANFSRIFRRAAFFFLTVAYRELFGSFPRSSDNNRNPAKGTGTFWFHLVLRVAASRPKRIYVIPEKFPAQADVMHRDRVIRELQGLSRLTLKTKAKLLSKAVREVRAHPPVYDQSEEDDFAPLGEDDFVPPDFDSDEPE